MKIKSIVIRNNANPWELEKKLVQKYLNQGLLLDARKIHHRLLPRLSAGLKAHRRHL